MESHIKQHTYDIFCQPEAHLSQYQSHCYSCPVVSELQIIEKALEIWTPSDWVI
jgi:hypothetical protein